MVIEMMTFSNQLLQKIIKAPEKYYEKDGRFIFIKNKKRMTIRLKVKRIQTHIILFDAVYVDMSQISIEINVLHMLDDLPSIDADTLDDYFFRLCTSVIRFLKDYEQYNSEMPSSGKILYGIGNSEKYTYYVIRMHHNKTAFEISIRTSKETLNWLTFYGNAAIINNIDIPDTTNWTDEEWLLWTMAHQ